MRGLRLVVSVLVATVLGTWLLRFVFADAELLRGSSDLRNYFFPLYELTRTRLTAGELPLWNAFHLTGYPQLATLQGGFFYPPHLLYLVFATPTALALSHALHLAFIAVATVIFLRRFEVVPIAAAVAAGVFALHGAVQWWLLWPAMLESAAWLPLGCAAVVDLVRTGRARGVALLALAAGMTLLAGHAQVAGYLAWSWTTLLVVLLLARRAGPREWLGATLRFAAAGSVGVLLSAVQTAPVAELTWQGTRDLGGIPRSQVLAMGAGGFRSLLDAVSGSRFALSVVALVLAPAACVGRARAVGLWTLALAAVSVAIASVESERAVALYQAIPGIGAFRSPRRILFLAGFGVAMAAGLGLDALVRGGDPAAERSSRRAAGIVVAAGVAWALALAIAGGFVQAALAGLVSAWTLAMGFFAKRRAQRGDALLAGGVVLLAAVGTWIGEPLAGRLPYDPAAADRYYENADAQRELASRLRGDRAVWLPLLRARDTKLAGVFGLRRLDDFEPLNLRRQAEYFDYFQSGTAHVADARRFFSGDVIPERRARLDEREREARDMARRRRLLDLAATRMFVTPPGLGRVQRHFAETFASAAGLEPAPAAGGHTIHTNPNAVPRAFATHRVLAAPPVEDLLAALSDPSFDPLAASYVEGDVSLPPLAVAPRGSAVALVRDEAHLVELEATLPAPGLVVLADSVYPGWRAFVDDTPAAIHPTNHLYRGVVVPAGRHRVRFEYRPWTLVAGAATSFAAAVGLGVAGLRRRRAPDAASGSG